MLLIKKKNIFISTYTLVYFYSYRNASIGSRRDALIAG
jgi:hypothetical protein